MPSRRRAQFVYNADQIASLQGIALPEKIKCGRCQKNLPQAKYSTNQRTELRQQIKTSGRCTKPINCQTCTGQQIVEIQCVVCRKTKGLEGFAKSQRGDPDTAECYDCTEDRTSLQPVDHDKWEDINASPFLTPDTSNGVVPNYHSSAESTAESQAWNDYNIDSNTVQDGGVSLAQQFHRTASIVGSSSGTLIQTDGEVSYPGRNSTEQARSDAGRTGSWRTAMSTAAGSASLRPPSIAGTQRTFSSGVAENSNTSSSGQSLAPPMASGASANRGGPLQSPFVRPSGDTIREIDNAWRSDSEEEEDDDDDDDDDSDGEDTVI